MDIMDSVEEEASEREFCQDRMDELIHENGDIANDLGDPMEGLIGMEMNNKEEPPPQKLDLKELPSTLKYAFLDCNSNFPVIIVAILDQEKEKRLLKVLRRYKMAIGWTLDDIKGISPTLCMHKILLEVDTKPTREAQCRLNPIMQEVVKKEVLKLLDVGIIYPISDSKWVSPIHVVPKKSRFTVVKNE